jgi:hypothetical protein
MDKEQLQALRCQVEEEYKLDIAAIQWLQQRFAGISSSSSYSRPAAPPSPELTTALLDPPIPEPAPESMSAPTHLSAPADRLSAPPPARIDRRIDGPRSSTRADAERWMQEAQRQGAH